MAAATIVHDTSEAVALCPALGLYLKPITKLTITVSLPPPSPPSPSEPGRAVSNWEVMERLKALLAPAQAQFSALRLSRSAPDAVRFEAELERRALLCPCLALLDGRALRLPGFSEPLRVRAAEFRPYFPSPRDWDAFFRDAADMDETLPGERPDTVRLEGLPCRWFAPRADASAAAGTPGVGGTSGAADRPSEALLRQAFCGFGDVRRVDVPMLDPYRGGEAAGRSFHAFGLGGPLHFEAYVQFREPAGFARAMAALRGMKLMLKGDDGKAVACAIKVSFDCTKHLSDASIRRRQLEQQKLQELELQREEQKRREKEAEEQKQEEERKQKQLEEQERERRREEKLRRREQRQREREQRRGRRRVEKLQAEEQRLLQEKIRTEERKLLLAQRNLQSIRLVAELLTRAEAMKLRQRERSEEQRRRQGQEEQRRLQEAELRRVEEEKARALGLQRRERELLQHLLSLLLGRRPACCSDPAPSADDLLRPMLDVLHRVTHAQPPRDLDPKAPVEPAVLACIPENTPPKPGASPTREPPPPLPLRNHDEHNKCNREPKPPRDPDTEREGHGGEGGGGRWRRSSQEWLRQQRRRAHVDGADTEEGEEPWDSEERKRRRHRDKDKERGRERKHSRHGRHSRSRSRSPRRRSTWNR